MIAMLGNTWQHFGITLYTIKVSEYFFVNKGSIIDIQVILFIVIT